MARVESSRVLDAIRQISLCANSKPQAEQALHCAVEHAREILDCQTIAVILANYETGDFGIKISRGLTNRFLTGYRSKLAPEGITEDVWWREPLLVTQADSESEEYETQKLERDFASAVSAPIAVDARLIGYVFCDSPEPAAAAQPRRNRRRDTRCCETDRRTRSGEILTRRSIWWTPARARCRLPCALGRPRRARERTQPFHAPEWGR